jgi:hypothetical protein
MDFADLDGMILGKICPLVMTNIAIENDHRNSGFSLIKNGGSFHSYVKLPEGG